MKLHIHRIATPCSEKEGGRYILSNGDKLTIQLIALITTAESKRRLLTKR